MGILRRKKDESGRALLESNHRTFLRFRKSDSNHSSGRSDNPGTTKTGLSSAAHWGKVRAPNTPPLTPRTPENHNDVNKYNDNQEVLYTNAPVADVTLVKGSSKTSKHNKAYANLQYCQEIPSNNSNNDGVEDDDHSEYSDLTDNRTQQRLIEQKVLYERMIEERKLREKALADSPDRSGSHHYHPSSVLRAKTKQNLDSGATRESSTNTNTNSEEATVPATGEGSNFFADLFGLMDLACKPTSQPSSTADDTKSFAPEWGLAPTKDDTEFAGNNNESNNQKKDKKMETTKQNYNNKTNENDRGPSPALIDTVSESLEEDDDDGDMADRKQDNRKSDQRRRPAHHYDDDDEEEDDDDDDIFSDVDNSQTSIQQQQAVPPLPRSPQSPRSTHENFEMVLEELQEEEFSPKGKPTRPWIKNPFNRGRANKGAVEASAAAPEFVVQEVPPPAPAVTKKEIRIAPDKALQDRVKQTLFPDYDNPIATTKKGNHTNKNNTSRAMSPSLRGGNTTPPPLEQSAAHSQPAKKSPKKSRDVAAHSPQVPNPRKHQDAAVAAPTSPSTIHKVVSQQQNNEDYYLEEKKEDAEYDDDVPDPGLELPEMASDTEPPKKRLGKAIFQSLRLRSKPQRPMTTLEPVQEGVPSTPEDMGRSHSGSTGSGSRGGYLRGKLRNVRRRGLIRTASSTDEKTTSSGDSTDPSSSEPKSSSNTTMEQQEEMPTKKSTGRLTPLVEAAESQDHGEEEANDPGFVGGFMSMISETVAAVQAGKPIPEEVKKIPDKHNNNGIPQSKTWLGEEQEPNTAATQLNDVGSDLRRSQSAPHTVGKKQFKRRKQVWKEVKDPNSGRPYYYHRITRQTTWTRPKEMDAPLDPQENNSKSTKPRPADPEQEGQPPSHDSIQRLKSAEEKLNAVRQSRGLQQQDSVRKTSARDFDPDVWNQKQKIVQLLQSMAPPDGTSIESLMAQYEGRENELLEHVRRMKDSRPFDEPIGADEEEGEGGGGAQIPVIQPLQEPLVTKDSTQTSFLRTASGVTSRQSESTQLIRNTKSPRRMEENTIGGSSWSSSYGKGPSSRTKAVQVMQRVPSKIPAPRMRSRELMVEEFSQDRYKFETFNNKELGGATLRREASPVRIRQFSNTPYGTTTTIEEEEEPPPTDADSSHANDTVSALSVNEFEFIQPAAPPSYGTEEARRRALEDAIRREDWDMAAMISEKMRDNPSKDDLSSRRQKRGEWKQSELDRFISENDWGAVSDYIAQLRSKSKAEGTDNRKNPSQTRRGKYSQMLSDGKPSQDGYSGGGQSRHSGRGSSRSRKATKKRFGARSQLQHSNREPVDQSSSSEASEESEEDEDASYYSTESSSSAPPRHPRTERRKQPRKRRVSSRY